jgi:hypothetical protein
MTRRVLALAGVSTPQPLDVYRLQGPTLDQGTILGLQRMPEIPDEIE